MPTQVLLQTWFIFTWVFSCLEEKLFESPGNASGNVDRVTGPGAGRDAAGRKEGTSCIPRRSRTGSKLTGEAGWEVRFTQILAPQVRIVGSACRQGRGRGGGIDNHGVRVVSRTGHVKCRGDEKPLGGGTRQKKRPKTRWQKRRAKRPWQTELQRMRRTPQLAGKKQR